MSGGKARLDLGSDFRIKGEGCLSCTPMGLQEDNVRAMQTGTGPGLTVGLLSRLGLSPNTTALLGRTTAREAETPRTLPGETRLGPNGGLPGSSPGSLEGGPGPRGKGRLTQGLLVLNAGRTGFCGVNFLWKMPSWLHSAHCPLQAKRSTDKKQPRY